MSRPTGKIASWLWGTPTAEEVESSASSSESYDEQDAEEIAYRLSSIDASPDPIVPAAPGKRVRPAKVGGLAKKPASEKKESSASSGTLSAGTTSAGRPWFRIGNRFASKEAFVAAGGIVPDPVDPAPSACPLILKTGLTDKGRRWYVINGAFVSREEWFKVGGKLTKADEKKSPKKKRASKKTGKK